MSHKPLNDTELDAFVVRALSRLPAHAPSRRFADSVMARVQQPQPRPVVVYRRARAWVSQPRRALTLAGAYVAAATVALVVAVPWLVQHSPALQLGLDWTLAQAGGLIRDASLGLASWWVGSGLADATRAVPRSGAKLWLSLVSLTTVYGGCAVGLHLLLRAPRVAHASVPLQA